MGGKIAIAMRERVEGREEGEKKEREREKEMVRHLRLVGTLWRSRGSDCVMRGLYIGKTDEYDWNTWQG